MNKKMKALDLKSSIESALRRCILIVVAYSTLFFCSAIAGITPAKGQQVLFNFDNIPVYTPFPVNTTAGAITAHLYGTGQGYSIQDANVLGFTPVGFSGHVIYPNSIYLADLLIKFDQTITGFSIMYSCQELGCDDAATMKVTAYMNGTLVGFNTKTATHPGTWPVDSLTCYFNQGFDSVVVHYNSPPPTCQDYGVIYMADNMRVNMGCLLPAQPGTIATTGGNAKVCPGDTRTYTTATATGVTWYWTVPTGAIINSGQGTNAINVTYNSGFTANGVISVAKVNTCGQGPARTLNVVRNVPAKPGTLTGTFTALCGDAGVVYAVPAATGVTYNWTTPAGTTITSGQTTHSITVDFPSIPFSGNIAVTANNACGASAVQQKAVKGVPATPAAITGPACVAANSSGNAFAISPIATAVTYTWTGPAGSHITGNGVTSANNVFTTPATAVTVSFAAVTATSTLKVRANNSCGSGAVRTLALAVCPSARLSSSADERTTLFPNPVIDIVTLKFFAGDMNNCEVIIEDLTGRAVLQQTAITSAGWNELQFDLSDYNSGVYFLHLKTISGEQLIRILKK
jgi:hypothetical protein